MLMQWLDRALGSSPPDADRVRAREPRAIPKRSRWLALSSSPFLAFGFELTNPTLGVDAPGYGGDRRRGHRELQSPALRGHAALQGGRARVLAVRVGLLRRPLEDPRTRTGHRRRSLHVARRRRDWVEPSRTPPFCRDGSRGLTRAPCSPMAAMPSYGWASAGRSCGWPRFRSGSTRSPESSLADDMSTGSRSAGRGETHRRAVSPPR